MNLEESGDSKDSVTACPLHADPSENTQEGYSDLDSAEIIQHRMEKFDAIAEWLDTFFSSDIFISAYTQAAVINAAVFVTNVGYIEPRPGERRNILLTRNTVRVDRSTEYTIRYGVWWPTEYINNAITIDDEFFSIMRTAFAYGIHRAVAGTCGCINCSSYRRFNPIRRGVRYRAEERRRRCLTTHGKPRQYSAKVLCGCCLCRDMRMIARFYYGLEDCLHCARFRAAFSNDGAHSIGCGCDSCVDIGTVDRAICKEPGCSRFMFCTCPACVSA